jgi:RNA recognition motif-containing protein
MLLKIYIGNLSIQTTEEQITELFVPYGPVESVKTIDRNKDNSRYAFVQMTSGAKEAVDELDGQLFKDIQIKVNWAFKQTFTVKDPIQTIWGQYTAPRLNIDDIDSTVSKRYQGNSNKESVPALHNLHHVFVGDLCPFVTDEILYVCLSN